MPFRKFLFYATMFVACSGPSFTQTTEAVPATSTTNEINACVSRFTGITRIVKKENDCLKEIETFRQWNIVGPQGQTGPAGPMGLQGLPGLPGLQGAPGPQGAPGAVGAKGAQGVAGPAGPQGSIGPQGSQGLPGAAGPAGPLGPAGAAGPAGPAGQQGVAGPIGPQGVAGPSGPTGPKGDTGPAGPAGPGGGTIPTNLTTLSNDLSTNGVAFLGASTFRYDAALCQVGDVVLSVNGYGVGALPADGRILPITGNTAIFSLIGTNFGGNGTSNFGLPDLRAFAPKGLQYSICVQGIFPSEN